MSAMTVQPVGTFAQFIAFFVVAKIAANNCRRFCNRDAKRAQCPGKQKSFGSHKPSNLALASSTACLQLAYLSGAAVAFCLVLHDVPLELGWGRGIWDRMVQFETDNPWQSTSLKGTLHTNVSTDELDAITSDIQRQHLPMFEQFPFRTLLNSLFIKIHLIRPCRKPSSITLVDWLNRRANLRCDCAICQAVKEKRKKVPSPGEILYTVVGDQQAAMNGRIHFCPTEKLVYIPNGMHDVCGL
ncbi:hypothetical protein T07_14730 [Trichinella nelsoni]|uniref:Uncharacterized protein n=2 Tax=Trichinella TaxID=6333 RepID=A0A0V0SD58_9BILA|nr:hypothetical protein T07_14730 [Trichinella nelsoni]